MENNIEPIMVMDGDDFKRMQDQFNKDTSTLLKASTLLNEANKELDRLRKENIEYALEIQTRGKQIREQAEQNTTLVDFNRTWLQEFEERFKVEQHADSDQIARDYIKQATWMASTFGRHNHSIAEVQAWIDKDNLPY